MKPMGRLTRAANLDYLGKFSLMKQDGYWRCCLGAIAWYRNPSKANRQLEYMGRGDTMNEAIEDCLKNNINVDMIDEKVEQDELDGKL